MLVNNVFILSIYVDVIITLLSSSTHSVVDRGAVTEFSHAAETINVSSVVLMAADMVVFS